MSRPNKQDENQEAAAAALTDPQPGPSPHSGARQKEGHLIPPAPDLESTLKMISDEWSSDHEESQTPSTGQVIYDLYVYLSKLE